LVSFFSDADFSGIQNADVVLLAGNWIVDDSEYEYLLNVCADVHDVPTCVGHSACQTKPLDPTFVKQLGLSSGRPVIEEGVLKLRLIGGRPCHGSTVQRQTTIIFSCGQTDSLGKPRFLEVSLSSTINLAAASSEHIQSPLSANDINNNLKHRKLTIACTSSLGKPRRLALKTLFLSQSCSSPFPSS